MKKKSSKKVLSKNKLPKNVYPIKKMDSKKIIFDFFGLAIIVLLGIIIYSNSFNCSFHYDDVIRIVDNPYIKNLSDIKAWWNYYPTRPIAFFTFALNYHFNQLDIQYWHFFNLFIHLINTCLVWWLTIIIFSTPTMKDQSIARNKKILAFFTAMLFVSHPLATESVTYISQRMVPLVAMFYFLSLALYVKARLTKKGDKLRYIMFICSFFSAVAAMLTKENAFTLPFAIILFEIFFLQTRKLSINFKDYRVILLIAAFLSFIIIVLLKFPLNIFDPIPPSHSRACSYTITSHNYLLTQFSVIVKYIQLFILPINQNLDYDFPISNNFFEISTLFSFLLILSLITLAIFLFKKHKIFSFGIFWFFLTLSIESSIIPIDDIIFEHRTYLPSLGYFLILSTGIYALFWRKYKYLSIFLYVIIIGTNSFLTYERNKIWKDELSLWNDVVSKSPNKARPFLNRGFIYYNQSEYNIAIDDFTKAIELMPDYYEAYNNRGTAFKKQGLYEKAINDFTYAIVLKPDFTIAYNNRGEAYGNLGLYDKALNDLKSAIDLEPNFSEPYYNRGRIYYFKGKINDAIKDFTKAIELKPDYADAFNNRGVMYIDQKLFENACHDFKKAEQLGSQDGKDNVVKFCK